MTDSMRAVRTYVRQVQRQLNCPPVERRRLTQRLERTVSAYVEENPDVTLESLVAALGEPEGMAAQLLEEYGLQAAGRWSQGRSRRLGAAILLLCLLLAGSIFWMGFVALNNVYEESQIRVYITESLPPAP